MGEKNLDNALKRLLAMEPRPTRQSTPGTPPMPDIPDPAQVAAPEANPLSDPPLRVWLARQDDTDEPFYWAAPDDPHDFEYALVPVAGNQLAAWEGQSDEDRLRIRTAVVPLLEAWERGGASSWATIDAIARAVLTHTIPTGGTMDPALLTDPNAVHLNMLRGTIAKPSWAQILHLYSEEERSVPDHSTERRGRP